MNSVHQVLFFLLEFGQGLAKIVENIRKGNSLYSRAQRCNHDFLNSLCALLGFQNRVGELIEGHLEHCQDWINARRLQGSIEMDAHEYLAHIDTRTSPRGFEDHS